MDYKGFICTREYEDLLYKTVHDWLVDYIKSGGVIHIAKWEIGYQLQYNIKTFRELAGKQGYRLCNLYQNNFQILETILNKS